MLTEISGFKGHSRDPKASWERIYKWQYFIIKYSELNDSPATLSGNNWALPGIRVIRILGFSDKLRNCVKEEGQD